ncbi:MAG: TolC family protein [Longimicrobiaceae bacterium]
MTPSFLRRALGDGIRRLAAAAACAALLPAAARAQLPDIPAGPRSLTLESAMELAREHNPGLAQQANDVRMAGVSIRSAYGDLLPGLSLSSSLGYMASGERRVGSVSLGDQPSVYSSNYAVSASYALSAPKLLQPAVARAEARETEKRVAGSAATLRADVSRRYLAVLQAQARLRQSDRDVARAADYLRQATAQANAGMTSPLDRQRSQVNHAQAEIRRLQARRTLRNEVVSLGRTLGVALDPEVELPSRFELFEPRWSRDELVAAALRDNPALQAARGQVESARARTGAARAGYLPTLTLSVGMNGWIQRSGDVEALVRQRLGTGTVSPQVEAEIRERVRRENQGFPFGYNSQPLSASATVSLPLFQGYARRTQVERSRAAAEDADAHRRGEELRVFTEVTAALANVVSAYELARAQTVVREQAAEELRLADQRLRMGASHQLAVTDAQARLGQAELDEIDAVYAFHVGLADLEALVGAPLR